MPTAYRDDPEGIEAGFRDADCLAWARYCWDRGTPAIRHVWLRRWAVTGRIARLDRTIDNRWTHVCRLEARLRMEYPLATPPLWRMRFAFLRSGADHVGKWLAPA